MLAVGQLARCWEGGPRGATEVQGREGLSAVWLVLYRRTGGQFDAPVQCLPGCARTPFPPFGLLRDEQETTRLLTVALYFAAAASASIRTDISVSSSTFGVCAPAQYPAMSALFYTERIPRSIRVAQVVGITSSALFAGMPNTQARPSYRG